MNIIKPIESRAIYQIQSGQVIVDLCSAVKELVENSLDAGATSIDIKFKNYGLVAIEVQDNGNGISPQNYETLALKHYTSKISTYSDLTTLQTFGFRGEALSSLCALSVIKITTCLAQDAPKGTRLEFEVSGKLKKQSMIAAQKGTTVSIENLFRNLPVRRRELERNIKREWSKVTGILAQYACIQTGVRFSISQQTGNGKKTTVLSTNGNQLTKENIANIFGARMLTHLASFDLNLITETKRSFQQDGKSKNKIRFSGHISMPSSGEGRQIPDRQLFFINARPCNLPQIAKTFIEVYRSFSGTQSPFIFANIQLDTHLYDVNVSPDKRTILLHDQNHILEALKSALSKFFESQNITIPLAKVSTQKQTTYTQSEIGVESVLGASQNIPSTPCPQKLRPSSERSSINNHHQSSAGPSYDPNQLLKNSEDIDFARTSLTSLSDQSEIKETCVDIRGQTSSPPETFLARDLGQGTEPIGSTQEETEQMTSGEISDTSSNATEATITPAQVQLPSCPSDHVNFGRSNTKRHHKNRGSAADTEEPLSPETPVNFSSFTKSYSKAPSRNLTLRKPATISTKNNTLASYLTTPCPPRNSSRNALPASKHLRDLQASPSTLSTPKESINQNFSTRSTGEQVTGRESDATESNTDEAYFSQISQPSPGISECNQNDKSDGLGISSTNPVGNSLSAEETRSSQLSASTPEIDGDFMNEATKKFKQEATVEELIQKAQNSTTLPCLEKLHRSNAAFKRSKKDSTLNLIQKITTDLSQIKKQQQALERQLSHFPHDTTVQADNPLESIHAEERLSLTISKADFAQMRVIGQFNLGFIIVSRLSENTQASVADDLFIIDQHASDEKYNFERLQATTIIQSQALVIPKTLYLTPIEEEIVMDNLPALQSNGFVVAVDESADRPVGQRCQLMSLPLSRETAFSLADFDELVSLLVEPSATVSGIPRPSKVRKMLAMRACRSSIMIGKTLTQKQMEKVVRHLGELDKPWNCPHGRPTMRHLCGLGAWDGAGWMELGNRGI